MKCYVVEKSILLQGSEELGSAKARAVAAHLADCESCRHFKQAMVDSESAFDMLFEPSAKVVQDVLRTARLNVPVKKHARVFGLKPSMAMAASIVIGLGVYFSSSVPDKVGMVLVVTESQLLASEDQVVSIMYDGLSEDDLAFNFLMTYEDDLEG